VSLSPWITLQIGAREHYAIPRALHHLGALAGLVTDLWLPPQTPLAALPALQRLHDRWHPQLGDARVWAPTRRQLLAEAWLAARSRRQGWAGILARNQSFQRFAAAQLARFGPRLPPHTVLFAYSYAARLPLAVARAQGWRTVLGQIDPGPEEERIVAAERRRYPDLATTWQPAPPSYWQQWRQELDQAHRVLVNSRWSQQCLLLAEVPAHKLRIVPLIYDAALAPPAARMARSPGAPFHLLFLGTIGLRKGVARLLEAMRLLEGVPIQLTLAGPTEIDPASWAGRPNIRWIGAVPRSQVGGLYAAADAFVLPTLSDGFALTQLEALAHGCPVIASPCCGDVVRPGRNGWLLPSLEPDSMAATFRHAAETAILLPRPLLCPSFGLEHLADALLHLFDPA
jgi:glycosyltransferase involved in cell wall biosynthesis